MEIKVKLPTDPPSPMAKVDGYNWLSGYLVTTPNGLKKLYLETYFKRLAHRTIDNKYEDIFELTKSYGN